MHNRVKLKMDKLAQNLKNYDDVLCLLGLGSMAQLDRLDQYSDMDFFLIVKNDSKKRFINNLDWLSFESITFSFRNSNDGYKVLYHDSIFAEFAIFTEDEITKATFNEGLIYYKKEGFDESLVVPKVINKHKPIDKDYLINESLSNIYIGLKRNIRGEISSATTFIQTYAYNLIIALFPLIYTENIVDLDPFVYERRIEQRFPESRQLLLDFRQGSSKNIESANAMILFLLKHFKPNEAMIKEIRSMIHNEDKETKWKNF